MKVSPGRPPGVAFIDLAPAGKEQLNDLGLGLRFRDVWGFVCIYYAHVSIYIYICTYACAYVCMYVYVYVYLSWGELLM